MIASHLLKGNRLACERSLFLLISSFLARSVPAVLPCPALLWRLQLCRRLPQVPDGGLLCLLNLEFTFDAQQDLQPQISCEFKVM